MGKLIRGEYPYKDINSKIEKKKLNKERELDKKQSNSGENRRHFIYNRKLLYIKKYGKIFGTLIYLFKEKFFKKEDANIIYNRVIRSSELLDEKTASDAACTIYTILNLTRNRHNTDKQISAKQISAPLYRSYNFLKLIKDPNIEK